MPDQPVKILWIDDECDKFDHLVDDLKSQFQSQCELVIDLVGSTEELKKKDVAEYAIILTDYHLDEETTGADIIQLIRESLCVADVILYSQVQEISGIDTVRWLGHCAYTETLNRREEIQNRLPKLISRNIDKMSDLFILRGLMLSDFINLELKVNELILSYYCLPDDKATEFMLQVLENKFIPAYAKSEILQEIEKSIKSKAATPPTQPQQELLALLGNIRKRFQENIGERNKFAHYHEDGAHLKSGSHRRSLEPEEMMKLKKSIKENAILIDQLLKIWKPAGGATAAPRPAPKTMQVSEGGVVYRKRPHGR